MQMYTCLPAVLALGVARALTDAGVEGVAVSWPSSVSVDGRGVARIDAHAGYDNGLYANCDLVELEEGSPISANAELVGDAMEEAASSWEAALRRAGTVAGPLAPVLNEYFDLLDCANSEVEIVFPNGRVAARGTLAGMDVWGRATVRTPSGQELEVSPEQASLRRPNR